MTRSQTLIARTDGRTDGLTKMNSTTSDHETSVTRAGGQPESPREVTNAASGELGSIDTLDEILTRYHGNTHTGLRPALHEWLTHHDAAIAKRALRDAADAAETERPFEDHVGEWLRARGQG